MKTISASRGSGPLLMLAAAILFSTGGLLCKLIPWSPFAINGVRSLIAAAVIALYLLFTRHKLRFNRYTFIGAAAYMGTTTFYVAANKLTTAANTIVLQYTAPVWIMIMSAVFFREKPKKLQLITILTVFAGIVCFFLDGLGTGSTAGDLLAAASGITYAALFILNSFPEGDTLSALLIGQLVSAVLMGPTVTGETDFSPAVVAAVLVLGLLQVGVAYIFFSEGTARTSPVTASLVCAVEPILNPILVAIILKETVKPLSLVGAAIVVGAVLVYNILSAESKKGENAAAE